jgi:hypothetical protein
LSDRDALLAAVVQDLLTHSDYRHVIDDYGVPGAKEYALATNSEVPWPEGFASPVPGYKLHWLRLGVDEPLDSEKPALACISLSKLQFDPNRDKFDDESTARGSKGGGFLGGCTVWYDYRRAAGRWEVVCAGLVAP